MWHLLAFSKGFNEKFFIYSTVGRAANQSALLPMSELGFRVLPMYTNMGIKSSNADHHPWRKTHSVSSRWKCDWFSGCYYIRFGGINLTGSDLVMHVISHSTQHRSKLLQSQQQTDGGGFIWLLISCLEELITLLSKNITLLSQFSTSMIFTYNNSTQALRTRLYLTWYTV